MTRRLRDPIPDDIIVSQRKAADPNSSVWVEANAGSGKTHVLTERVLRLLLEDVRPEEILCLTYTKAAATEMRRRVSERLSAWALLDDAALERQLVVLTGAAVAAARRLRARTLFAHALETPGGLKIQTIHAFCEAVLHRFPVEAGVPFDFTVIEDHERDAMILAARESVLSGGLKDRAETGVVETLFELMSDFAIGEAIDIALADSRRLRHVLTDMEDAKARLRKLAALRPGETRAALRREAVEGSLFPSEDWPALFAHLPPDAQKSRNLNFAERLYRLRHRPLDAELLLEAFLKEGWEPYKDRCTANITDPDLAEAVGAEHDRLAALAPRLRVTNLVERSEALLDVLGAISRRYEAEKRARAQLDFDDLIERLAALLRDEAQGPWVQYKLDAGIAHILVDESQDTNAEQWEVVNLLAREFFAGQGAVEKLRTLFAVGDGKQSIYSFQGADPSLFGASGRDFAVRAEIVGMRFAREPLHTSFRTLPGILSAVDRVFDSDLMRGAVLASDPIRHFTARSETGGMVTLWPPVRAAGEVSDAHDWPLEVPDSLQSAPRQVAVRIARTISGWIGGRRPLGPRGRAVRPEDVLILVQTRSMLFHEIIRALIRERLPTPGADRLAVTSHIGVLDLLALGDVLLNPADDLQLAALLRSPLFDVDEAGLHALAQPRPDGAGLWEALRGSTLPSARAAYRQLHAWRGRLDFDRPFELYAGILYGEEGLKRFHARMGSEIDDVFAEFLDLALAHEQTENPSLQGFLAAMRSREVSIKRELPGSSGGVRVMTVHGAKGLESPIVILADAASRPQGRQLSKPVVIRTNPPLFVHASAKKDHIEGTLALREEAEARQMQEYWRKLYVGMTRAEDELYVTGALTPGRDAGKQLKDTWYEAIERALGPASEVIEGAEPALIYPRERPEPRPVTSRTEVTTTGQQALALPALSKPAQVPIVRPSSAFVPADELRVLESAAEAVTDAELARKRGIALHALLQHLGRVMPGEWERVSEKALRVLLPDYPGEHPALANKARSILTRPDLSHLFGANSRAEVPFLANASRDGVPIRLAGRIDRLVVEPDRVLIVDFKSDAVATTGPAAVPAAYLTQLGLYALTATQLFPRLRVDAAILWTSLESLLELPRELLAEAARSFTMR
ncbi:MAG: double-strand break repair helicase AddA [Devosia sp.]